MNSPRTRRSSDEVRNLMLTSARDLFRSQGFEATSTREISERAGVSESMLFRHFGCKSAVFEQSVLKPFIEFIERFVTDWTTQPRSDVVPEALADTYVRGLFRLCHDNVDLLSALDVRHADEVNRSVARHAHGLIQEHLSVLAGQVQKFHDDIGLPPAMDPLLAVRLTVAIVVGGAHLGTGFFGIDDEALGAETAAFVVRGAGYPSNGHV